jgi:hypothetical protein
MLRWDKINILVLNGLFDKNKYKNNFIIINKKKMFGDIRNFVSLNTNATNLECIQNYVPLTAKNEDEINYFLDHRICLSNLISDS